MDGSPIMQQAGRARHRADCRIYLCIHMRSQPGARRGVAGAGAMRWARWLSQTLATTTAMPTNWAALRLWPSTPQPAARPSPG